MPGIYTPEEAKYAGVKTLNADGSQVAASSSTANTPAIATDATALAANASRKSWSIQNVGTNPLFVRLGAGASTALFHFILKGGTADSDGLGAIASDDIYTGIVTIAGTSPKYVVSELT